VHVQISVHSRRSEGHEHRMKARGNWSWDFRRNQQIGADCFCRPRHNRFTSYHPKSIARQQIAEGIGKDKRVERPHVAGI